MGVCSYKENDIGETKRNVINRWNEHEHPNKDSETVKHLFQHPDKCFSRKSSGVSTYEQSQKKKLGGIFHSNETSNFE